MFGDLASEQNVVRALLLRGEEQAALFSRARQVRDEVLGPRAEVRSVVEYANVCDQDCHYCGMGRSSGVPRYVLGASSLRRQLDLLYGAGRRVIMVQAGEHQQETFFASLFTALQEAAAAYPDLTFIFALGNLPDHQYAQLRTLGEHRYLLKFETSDPALFRTLRPRDTLPNRLQRIAKLKELGFRVSSGNITGLPGQDVRSLARDLLLLKELQLPMGSTSPFIPNNLSRLAGAAPADLDLALNFTAVLRIVCPAMLIPTTSALELLRPGGQLLGLMAGANTLTIHDGTPTERAGDFVIYRQQRHAPGGSLRELAAQAGLQCSDRPLLAAGAG